MPFRPLKICVSISYLAPRLLHTSNIVFKKYFPLVVLAPRCKILATDLNKKTENFCYEQKHVRVLI